MKCKICGKAFDETHYGEPYQDICSSECYSKQFWIEKIEVKDKLTIINGECYFIGDENDTSYFRGHAGRKFKIQKDNGEIIETTNLWYNGEIPEEFREELKDNAKFING